MNSVILRGRLTADAEIRITQDEKPTTIARFSLAVQDRTKRDDNGNYPVDFIKIVAFNSIANNISQFTSKGSEIIVMGRLHTYSYKNKNEQTVYMTEVITEKLEFVANCRKSEVEIPDIPDDELPFR